MSTCVAVIMGGYSSEKEISMQSGAVAVKYLRKAQYRVYPVHILEEKWVVLDDDEKEHPIDRGSFTTKIAGNLVSFDCVFNAVHGSPGEDGLMAAYFELLKIPLTGCNFHQAALTFNKRFLLAVAKNYGIKTAASWHLFKQDVIEPKKILEVVGLPCFVKPNSSGSSYGISKVTRAEALLQAIEKALKEDDEVLIESFLDGPEVSVGVITYKNEIRVLPVTQIISDNSFFDYEAKYLGKSQEITPAPLEQKIISKVKKEALKVYKMLNLRGFSRSEYIIVKDEPYLLEVNTVPGLTEASILPQQANQAGISLEQLFANSVREAMEN